MKLTTYLYLGAAAALACCSMSACNDINEDERFIPLPIVESERVVLLEEFTGQNCVNCPEAHETVKELMTQYPDNLISVSIHAGPLAYTEEQLPGIGLGNEYSEAIFSNYSIASVPAGVINRATKVLNRDQWAAEIRSALSSPIDIEMDVTATLSADGKTIDIASSIESYTNRSTTYELWVVESGIKTLQVTPTGVLMDYEHNHVLRSTVNGIKGEPLALTIREPVKLTHSINVKDAWNPANIDIIAIISDKDGVLQTRKAHVTQ